MHVFDTFSELRKNLSQLGLFQVITTEEIVFPRCRFVDHWQRTLKLKIEIVYLVKLTDELFDESSIEDNMANLFITLTSNLLGL